MTPEEHVGHLEVEGHRLAAAARQTLTAAVPSCPGWSMADLVGHVGFVHAWGRMQVESDPGERIRFRDVGDAGRPPDEPAAMLDWYERGLAALLEALRAVDPAVPRPTWAGVQPGTWFPRRMAHETSVHRWDGEQAIGEPAAFDPALAADGLDEHLEVFLPRIPAERIDRAGTIALRATDAGDTWMLRMAPGVLTGERGSGDADVALAASCSELLLFVWNRRGGDDLRQQVIGDRTVLAAWNEIVRV